jgi:carbamoyl-phosphate synthase large subunit
MNILFTSVGRRVELVRAFRDAVRELGINGKVIGADIQALAPALKCVDVPYIVPRLDSPDYIPTLARLCATEKVSLVFPLIDPDIQILSANKKEIESSGTRVMVVEPQGAQICEDKWQTTVLFRSLGLPTPKSWLSLEEESQDATFPLFIKPRKGSASQNTFKVKDVASLNFFTCYVPSPIIQEYIDGYEVTSDVVCFEPGEVLSIVSRRRIEVRSGEVSKGVTLYDKQIAQACELIARRLPAIGPITVQCIVKEGVPYFTEINARFGGGIPLGIAAGVNSPKLIIQRALGMPVTRKIAGEYKQGLYMSRYDESFFATEAECESMASRRV